MVLKCPSCLKDWSLGDLFCSYCGVQLVEMEKAEFVEFKSKGHPDAILSPIIKIESSGSLVKNTASLENIKKELRRGNHSVPWFNIPIKESKQTSYYKGTPIVDNNSVYSPRVFEQLTREQNAWDLLKGNKKEPSKKSNKYEIKKLAVQLIILLGLLPVIVQFMILIGSV